MKASKLILRRMARQVALIRPAAAACVPQSTAWPSTHSQCQLRNMRQCRSHPTSHVVARFSSMPIASDVVVEDSDEDEDDHDNDDEYGHGSAIDDPAWDPNNTAISTTNQTEVKKHCPTCACDHDQTHSDDHDHPSEPYPCGSAQHENEGNELPPDMPEPSYSVYMRILPSTLIAMRSQAGKTYLQEAMAQQTAEPYLALMEQFMNQSEPAFCGVTTLCMVLNAMGVDPNVRWRGGWRWYGSEDVLLDRCCLSAERIRRVGIALEEFEQLGRCQGLSIQLKRPFPPASAEQMPSSSFSSGHSVEDFRNDILRLLTNTATTTPAMPAANANANANNSDGSHHHPYQQQHALEENVKNPIVVVSFSRSALGQTGDGHFSPLAAYHAPTDSVLVLDVARFKYTPYWVPVEDLYRSMQPLDSTTNKSRGWLLLHPALIAQDGHDRDTNDSMTAVTAEHAIEVMERRRPAKTVPVVGQGDVCPVGSIKVEYCKVNPNAIQ